MLKIADETLWRKFKAMAAMRGKTLNEAIIDLIKKEVD